MKQVWFYAILTMLMGATGIAAGSDLVIVGEGVTDVSALMRRHGYKETTLQMDADSKDTALRMWHVGEGYLVMAYNIGTKRICGMNYLLLGTGPKSKRESFDLPVLEFDPESREMKIKIP